MPRRASSGIQPAVLLGVAVAIAAAFFGGKSLVAKKKTSFSDATQLPVSDFIENSNSLRGNEYVVEGTLDEKLRWTSDRGQVVSLKVKGDSGENFVPIEVPASLSSVNIEREQRYAFKVKLRQGGIPVAVDISRL